MKLLMIGLLLITSLLGKSQSEGSIKVITIPKNAIIRLDTTRLYNGKEKKIIPGNYTLKIWAPWFKLDSQQVSIISDSLSKIIRPLKLTKEFINYRSSDRFFGIKQTIMRYLPATLLLAVSLNEYYTIIDYDDQLDRSEFALLSAEKEYYNGRTIAAIKNARTKFYLQKHEYENMIDERNERLVYGITGISITAIISTYLLFRSFKMKRSTYSEKTLLSRCNFGINPVFGVSALTMSVNF